jgi:hypothetical protein
MLAMVFALPLGFVWLIWSSFRSEGERRERGELVSTPGAVRWTPGDVQR